jgi:hypothetical protein
VVELDLLGIDEDEPQLVRRGAGEHGGEHRVDAAGLAGAGRARHQEVRHLREVGADRPPGDVLAQPHGQRRPALGRLLQHVAEVDDLAARVGDLDADGLLAGDRGEDADVRGGQRVGEVVLELGDLGDLDAGREAQLVAGDVRARDHADDARLDPEVPQRLDQLGGDLLLPGGVRPVGLRARALEEGGVGDRPLEVGGLGDLGAVAPLRRELLGRRGGAGDAGLVGLRVLGEVGLLVRLRQLLGLRPFRGRLKVLGVAEHVGQRLVVLGERARDRAGARRRAELERGQLLGRGPAALDGGADLARGRGDRVAGGLDHAGHRGTGEEQHGGGEEEDRDRVRAEVAERARGRPVEPLPHDAAARLDPLGLPRDRATARPEAERARGEPERQRREQADRAGLERPHRGQHGPQHEDRARRHQRRGHDVVARADQHLQALDGAVAGLAAVPAEVDEEGEEDGRGDEAEPDDVVVALLELGQLGTGAAGPHLAPRLGLALGLGLGSAAGRRHLGRTPFDAARPDPASSWRGKSCR